MFASLAGVPVSKLFDVGSPHTHVLGPVTLEVKEVRHRAGVALAHMLQLSQHNQQAPRTQHTQDRA